jgi:hypothetical protein
MENSKIGKFAMWAAFIFALMVVCGLWGFSVPIHDFFFGTSEDQTESFESMNALFSGLAFVILIFTLWMQSRELEMQRNELKGTREAQEAMELRMAEQVEIARVSAILAARTALLSTQPDTIDPGDCAEKVSFYLVELEEKFSISKAVIERQMKFHKSINESLELLERFKKEAGD